MNVPTFRLKRQGTASVGAEPGVRGGARCKARRGEEVLFRKRNLTFIETKANRRESSSVFKEKNKTHFLTNCLTDRTHNKVSNAAQDKVAQYINFVVCV